MEEDGEFDASDWDLGRSIVGLAEWSSAPAVGGVSPPGRDLLKLRSAICRPKSFVSLAKKVLTWLET